MILLVKNLQNKNSKDAGIKYVLYIAEQYTANLSFLILPKSLTISLS